jgi:hypothetical protein
VEMGIQEYKESMDFRFRADDISHPEKSKKDLTKKKKNDLLFVSADIFSSKRFG